jgi:hypothetical protein
MSLTALCRICVYYNHTRGTCVRALTRLSGGNVYQDCAKLVRRDKSRCGPQGKWFEEDKGPGGLLKSVVPKTTAHHDTEHVVQELRVLLTG